MGRVNRITFGVPGTQVDTDRRSFLLEGVVMLDPGTNLEWRRFMADQNLCIVGSDRCWYLIGGNSSNLGAFEQSRTVVGR